MPLDPELQKPEQIESIWGKIDRFEISHIDRANRTIRIIDRNPKATNIGVFLIQEDGSLRAHKILGSECPVWEARDKAIKYLQSELDGAAVRTKMIKEMMEVLRG